MRKRLAVLGTALLVSVIAGSALAGGSGATFEVSSSLDGKSVLPLRSHWLAHTDLPPAEVSRVDFLIDGKVRWIERNAPYNYGSDEGGRNMGYLITTWLSPGLHRFTVRVTDKAGTAESATVNARVVAAPAPPPALAGRTWTRNDRSGAKWLLWFDRIGAWHQPVTRDGFVDQFEVRGDTLYVYAPVITGVQEIQKGTCRGNGCGPFIHDGVAYRAFGSDCNYSGPFGRYRWSVSGNTLTIKLIHEGCAARGRILAGTWKRVP